MPRHLAMGRASLWRAEVRRLRAATFPHLTLNVECRRVLAVENRDSGGATDPGFIAEWYGTVSTHRELADRPHKFKVLPSSFPLISSARMRLRPLLQQILRIPWQKWLETAQMRGAVKCLNKRQPERVSNSIVNLVKYFWTLQGAQPPMDRNYYRPNNLRVLPHVPPT